MLKISIFKISNLIKLVFYDNINQIMISRIKSFLQESKQEFKRINWPSVGETRRLTLIVIGISLSLAVFLGVLDFVFSIMLREII